MTGFFEQKLTLTTISFQISLSVEKYDMLNKKSNNVQLQTSKMCT